MIQSDEIEAYLATFGLHGHTKWSILATSINCWSPCPLKYLNYKLVVKFLTTCEPLGFPDLTLSLLWYKIFSELSDLFIRKSIKLFAIFRLMLFAENSALWTYKSNYQHHHVHVAKINTWHHWKVSRINRNEDAMMTMLLTKFPTFCLFSLPSPEQKERNESKAF